MSYVPAAGAVNASWLGASWYAGPIDKLSPSWGVGSNWITPSGIAYSAIDKPNIRIDQFFASVAGVDNLSYGVTFIDHATDYSYRPAQLTLNAAWLGAKPYGSVSGTFLRASWDNSIVALSPAGFNDSSVGYPILYGTQFANPEGFSTYVSGVKHFALYSYEYAQPQWVLDASWVGKPAYIAPTLTLNAAWALPSESKQVSITGWDSLGFGTPYLENRLSVVAPAGIAPEIIAMPLVANKAEPLRPSGISAFASGIATVWNWHQYVTPKSFLSDSYGIAFLQGGVKYATPGGISSLSIGHPVVINTTADQTAKPTSILWPGAGQPDVSPRSIQANGIYGYSTGFPLVQFPPQPKGWQSSTFGYSIVRDKTHRAYAQGIDSYQTGYPDVRDRAKYIQHNASVVTSIFGDIALKQINQKIRVDGFFSQETGDWSVVLSNKRAIPVAGFNALSFSDYTEIRNKTPSFTPLGWSSLVWGDADVGWRVRHVKPSGVPEPFNQVSLPSLWKTPDLKPSGIAPAAIPIHTIWPANRRIEQKGRDSYLSGSATIGFSYRVIRTQDRGIAASEYGQGRVEHYRRYLSVLGSEYLGFGLAWVSRNERFIYVSGIEAPGMHRHKIGGTQHLGPEGFESTRWLTRIVPESREIYPKTFGAAYGLATIQNLTRYIPVGGITTYPEQFMHWGVAKVWNRVQVIKMPEDDEQSGLAPPSWSKWLLIENRNKIFGAQGFNASRVATPLVANTARRVIPIGVPFVSLPVHQKTGSVTHRVRLLPVEGLEPPLLSRWSVVHNKAAPLLPNGLIASQFGDSAVVNLRRSFKIQGFYSQENGYPFISYAIRELTFESRYGIAPPQVNLPLVDLWTRYIDPKPITSYGVGHPSLGIFWRRITPRWTHSNSFGYALLKNKTPELLARGSATDESGNAFVRLEWRPLLAEGSSTQLFGRTRIADRKQQIVVSGNNYMIVSDKLTTRRIGEDPVITQYIDLRRFVHTPDGLPVENPDGYGIPIPERQVGNPDLSKGYIFPIGVGDQLKVGKPTVTANTIRVQPGYGELLIGKLIVSLKNRTLKVPTIDDTEIELGKPRLSPHTIYAVLEAPEQALRNHLMRRDQLRPISTGVVVGTPKVTTYLGYITTLGIPDKGSGGAWGVGTPRLVSMRRYIDVDGFYAGRMGLLSVPGVRNILVEEPIFSEEHGSHTVKRPPYIGPQTVKTSGITAPIIKINNIDHKNRTVKAASFFSQSMGASGLGSYTNMPQNLHVGFVFKNTVEGIYASGYSEPWISHKIRGLEVEGFESFASEYDYQNFQHRMRVRNIETNIKPRQNIIVAGIDGYSAGMPDFKPGLHFIRPDGNSDQHRKGAF